MKKAKIKYPGEKITKMNEKKDKLRKINPRGASVLVNLPKSKKKVGMYGLL